MPSQKEIHPGLGVLAAVFAILLVSFSISAPAASAAASGPAWSITGLPYPSRFAPGTEAVPFGAGGLGTGSILGAGPAYLIVATNVGGASATGEFKITDTLPSGVRPASAVAPEAYFGTGHLIESQQTPPECTIAGQLVTCRSEGTPVRSGEEVVLAVPLAVEATAPLEVIDVATVEGGGAEPVTTSFPTAVSGGEAPFGFSPGRNGLFTSANEADGTPVTQAGAHPYQMSVGLGFTLKNSASLPVETQGSGGGVRDFSTVLPAGLVVDPEATPVKCTEAQLEEKNRFEHSACPDASQMGSVVLRISTGGPVGSALVPVYNMVPPGGTPAELAFEAVQGTYIHLTGRVRNDGSYVLAAEANDIPAKVVVAGGQVNLWGEPSDPSHDGVRGNCSYRAGEEQSSEPICPLAERDRTAFLTMPSACSGPLRTTAEADSWLNPTTGLIKASVENSDTDGNAVGVTGCSALRFDPSLSVKPEVSTADSPTGLSVAIKVPQNEEYENEAGEPQLATANLKDVSVALPTGITVNPSAADGLAACSEAQIGYSPQAGSFNEARPQCPDASKVGTLEVETPLLDHTLPGEVFLAQPHENPFNSLLALYVVIDDPQSGIVVKLPGHVVPDSQTGQLTASFAENPQIPFSELRLKFFGGPRASLASPETCGTYASKAQLGPWSGTLPVALESIFATSSGPGGGGCASSPGSEPNSPSFEAGTTSSQAGAYAPFVLNIKREDGSQRISRVDTTLPLGLTGKLAGIPYCSDSALSAASGKTGREEQASPSCPSASEVGTATVGAGVGPNPYHVSGKAYLAGPYKGAPLSLAIITPAVAGPFDLGTVVVRSALKVDPFTAQITVESDPLPTILQGIPLDVRSISVQVAKPDFTLNPTNCEPTSISGQVVSVTNSSAQLSKPFQVGNCKSLKFKPQVKLSLKGSTKRTGHPALKAVVTYPKGGVYANIARAQVNLPHSEFIEQNNLNKTCTKPVLLEGKCPKSSIYGKAKAWTPLLDKPLQGNVYLVGGFGFKLPALVAELDGQIRVLLAGKVDSGPNKGIRNTFEAVPDAPVEKFVLEMKGGPKYSLLVNSENLCKKPQKAIARFTAQNGKVLQTKPLIANDCKKKSKGGNGKSKGGGKKKPKSGGKKHGK